MSQDGAMPQPFYGIFWQPGEKNDHRILEWAPERVCAWLAEIPGEDPAFLIGGACLDLRRNGYPEKAEALMTAAKAQWPPEFQWDLMEKTVAYLLQDMPPPSPRGVPPQVRALLYADLEMVSAIVRGEVPAPSDPI